MTYKSIAVCAGVASIALAGAAWSGERTRTGTAADVRGTGQTAVDSDHDGYLDGFEGVETEPLVLPVLAPIARAARGALAASSPASPTSPTSGAVGCSPPPTTPPPPCTVLDATPYPYCNAGSSSALAFRPPQSPLAACELLFLTQTSFQEDIVRLDLADATTELDRCCPSPSQTIGGMTHNGVFNCGSLDTLFVGNVTGGAGSIRELDIGSGGPVSAGDCTAGGADELACGAGASCSERRSFTFTGLTSSSRAEAITIVDGPFASSPLLVVSTISTLHFVDPTSPSCAAAAVDVVGTCGIPGVSIKGLASPGGGQLFVADGSGMLYRVDVTDTGAGFSCSVVSSCTAPGTGDGEGLTYDPTTDQLFVADQNGDTLYRMSPP